MQFSIITPTYNRADCLLNCIQSVIDQLSSFSDFEHIIVNDGSTDNTSALLKQLATDYCHVKIVEYGDNRGVNYARNRGIENAFGKFLILLDSDDLLNAYALRRISDTIYKMPSYDHYLFSVSTNALDLKFHKEVTYNDFISERFHGDYLHIVKRDFLVRLKFFEEFRAFEKLNWLRVIRETQPVLCYPLQVVTVNVRNEDSLSQKVYKSSTPKLLGESFRANQLFLNLYGAEIKKSSNKVYYKNVLALFFIGLRANLYAKNSEVIRTFIPSFFLQRLIIILFNNRLFSYILKSLYKLKYSLE